MNAVATRRLATPYQVTFNFRDFKICLRAHGLTMILLEFLRNMPCNRTNQDVWVFVLMVAPFILSAWLRQIKCEIQFVVVQKITHLSKISSCSLVAYQASSTAICKTCQRILEPTQRPSQRTLLRLTHLQLYQQ